MAQFRELEAFAQFASDLDDASREQLELGQKVTELMKQKQYSPMSVAEMGLVLFAVEKGYLKDVELTKSQILNPPFFLTCLQNTKILWMPF